MLKENNWEYIYDDGKLHTMIASNSKLAGSL